MSRFEWSPEGRVSAGSLRESERTVYLVRKNNGAYARLEHFEVLNTEIRALLFRCSYGYELALADFGRLQALQNTPGVRLR